MLSLLSLIIASGGVLRADTEQWAASLYPNPTTNSTQCNTWPNSTLCDPDHILTDQWRQTIHENINHHIDRLLHADVLYNEDAPEECHENTTEGVVIYVVLAKRIQTAANHSTTDTDLTEFGDGVADRYGLNSMPCKNFILILGVEAAKLAYVRTGKDLKLPPNLMEHVFNQYTRLFDEKNYMQGLNNIIDEIGDQLLDPFKTLSTEATSESVPETTTTSDILEQTRLLMTSGSSNAEKPLAPWWMYAVIGVAILCAVVSVCLLIVSRHRALQFQCSSTNPAMNSRDIDAFNGPRTNQIDVAYGGINGALGLEKKCDESSDDKSDMATLQTSAPSSNGGGSCYGISGSALQGQDSSKGPCTKHTLHDQLNVVACSPADACILEETIDEQVFGLAQKDATFNENPANAQSVPITAHQGQILTEARTAPHTPPADSPASASMDSAQDGARLVLDPSQQHNRQSLFHGRSSRGDWDRIKHPSDVTASTVPPKISTKVHLDADMLSTDTLTKTNLSREDTHI